MLPTRIILYRSRSASIPWRQGSQIVPQCGQMPTFWLFRPHFAHNPLLPTFCPQFNILEILKKIVWFLHFWVSFCSKICFFPARFARQSFYWLICSVPPFAHQALPVINVFNHFHFQSLPRNWLELTELTDWNWKWGEHCWSSNPDSS